METGVLDQVDHVPEGEAASSSNHEELFLWVDNYKCSICGIEMPPDFVEERQEHSDFHLAEKLQEESATDFKDSMPRQRYLVFFWNRYSSTMCLPSSDHYKQ